VIAIDTAPTPRLPAEEQDKAGKRHTCGQVDCTKYGAFREAARARTVRLVAVYNRNAAEGNLE
jgi:hypothetical protein